MNPLFDRCVTKIRSSGQRITAPKLELLKVLISSKSAMAITELIGKLSEKIDRVTVYRIIESFEKIGIVHQAGKNNLYMVCQHVDCEHSYHMITECISCGKIAEFDLNTEIFKDLKKQVKLLSGSSIQLSHLQIPVLCSSCS